MAANVRITQVLLKRGNTTAASNYTGPVGEVVIDTGLRTLRIQDGVTAGGHLLSGNGSSSYGNAEVKTYLGQFNGNITPSSNVTYSLGDSTHQWKELWLSGNTIHLGGAIINVDNGNLAINGTQVGIRGNVGPGVPVGGSTGQVLAKIDGDDYNTEWVDQTGGAADTGSFGFAGTAIYNKDDYNQGLYIAPGGESSSYVYVPGNSESDNTPIQITNSSGTGEVRLQAYDRRWVFNASGAITFPDSTVQSTAFTGNVASLVNGQYSVVLESDGYLAMPNDSNIRFNYGYVGQSANIQNNALRVSGGNAVVINTNEDGNSWQFTADGNLVLPTIVDFMSSPAGYLGGNIVFGDGTVQNTAYIRTAPVTVSTSAEGVEGDLWYNTEDGRLYVDVNNNGTITWVDASPSVIPGNMVAWDNDAIEFPDGSLQATAAGIYAGNTAPTAGFSWYNTEDGRTYNRVNGVWVDANPAVLPGDIVTFNDSGNITLPVGGQVTWANGRSILHGITPGTAANTGDISFEGMKIIGNNIDVPVAGLISLVPVKTFGGWDFEAWGQYIDIYPTNGFDAPHIHITAGSGAESTGDLFLGDDSRYVQVNHNGTVSIQSDSGSSTYNWQFDTTGNLVLPTNGSINYANGVSILSGITTTGDYSNSNVASYLPTYSGNIAGNIAKNGHTWTFAEDGTTTFPSNTIKTAGLLSLQTLSSTPSSVADWNGGGGWNQGFYGNLATTGGTGTGLTVDVAAGGSGYINIEAITINTPGAGYTDGDVITIENENNLAGTFTVGVTANNWTLDTTGDLIFPDSTVQTTAWTGILPNPTYSGSNAIGFATPAPLNLNNSAEATLLTQLNLLNTGGGAGAGSAIDFWTYSSINDVPEVRLQAVDDGDYSADFAIKIKQNGNEGNGSLTTTWTFGADGGTTFPDQGAVTITGNLTVDGITAGNILPAANVTYDLGSPTQQWNSLYVSSDTIYLGGVPLSVSGGTLLVNSSPLTATTGAVTFTNNKLTGGSVGQVGTQVIFATSASGTTSANSNGITLTADADSEQIVAGWTALFNNGGSRTVTSAYTSSGNRVLQINTSADYEYPITFRSPDYAPGEIATLQLTPNAEVASSTWSFYGNGNVQFPDGTTQTTAYVKTTGTWTVSTGSNTYSFTVPTNGVYQLWVRGNIPNGIVTYSATAVVTNPNVPVLGSQRGWYYEAGNALVLTSIPTQFVGTDNTISNASPSVGTTTNVFEFGITNNSGSTQSVEWGYTKL